MSVKELAPGLLVAAPPMGDPNFERSVVLLAAHSDEGAFGWIVNGAELMSISDLLRRAEIEAIPATPPHGKVRVGGPVGKEQVWLLYPTSQRLAEVDGQFEVSSGITACSSRLVLEEVARGRAPATLVGIAGYAGWGPNQLEGEIRSGAWLPAAADPRVVFELEGEASWLGVYQQLGIAPLAFSSRIVGSA